VVQLHPASLSKEVAMLHYFVPILEKLEASGEFIPPLYIPVSPESIALDLQIAEAQDLPPTDYDMIDDIYIPGDYALAFLINALKTAKLCEKEIEMFAIEFEDGSVFVDSRIYAV
jgi:hypothetical protein